MPLPTASTLPCPAQVEPESTGGAGDSDGLSHLYCCDKNVGLCGKDLSSYVDDLGMTSSEPDICVVCRYISLCTLCGVIFV